MANTNYRQNTEEAKRLRKLAGRYVRDLRLEKGLTQKNLTNLLGHAHPTFVSAVENGVNRVPPEALLKWAQALGVDGRKFAMKLLSYYDPYTHFAISKDRSRGAPDAILDEAEEIEETNE